MDVCVTWHTVMRDFSNVCKTARRQRPNLPIVKYLRLVTISIMKYLLTFLRFHSHGLIVLLVHVLYSYMLYLCASEYYIFRPHIHYNILCAYKTKCKSRCLADSIRNIASVLSLVRWIITYKFHTVVVVVVGVVVVVVVIPLKLFNRKNMQF